MLIMKIIPEFSKPNSFYKSINQLRCPGAYRQPASLRVTLAVRDIKEGRPLTCSGNGGVIRVESGSLELLKNLMSASQVDIWCRNLGEWTL